MIRKLLTIIVIIAACGFAYQRVRQPAPTPPSGTKWEYVVKYPDHPAAAAPAVFQCDGRVRCAQMTSCEEAMFFLQHCGGVKLDGDGDGIPCEDQWCSNLR